LPCWAKTPSASFPPDDLLCEAPNRLLGESAKTCRRQKI
jgi:hypothetical protein